jgi:hypothetical protein
MPGVNAPCYKFESIEYWARDCPITQANLIDFDESIGNNMPQGNTMQTQMTAEELKQTLYNLTLQQHSKLANQMAQQDEDFPNV